MNGLLPFAPELRVELLKIAERLVGDDVTGYTALAALIGYAEALEEWLARPLVPCEEAEASDEAGGG